MLDMSPFCWSCKSVHVWGRVDRVPVPVIPILYGTGRLAALARGIVKVEVFLDNMMDIGSKAADMSSCSLFFSRKH